MGNGVMSKGILDVARVFAGVSTVDFLDEQGSLGQLSQSIAWLKSGTSYLPRYFRRRYANGQTRQLYVFLIRGGELVIERCDLGRHCKHKKWKCEDRRLA